MTYVNDDKSKVVLVSDGFCKPPFGWVTVRGVYFFYLGPFLGDWIKHFDCLEKRASVVSSASVDFPVEGGHA